VETAQPKLGCPDAVHTNGLVLMSLRDFVPQKLKQFEDTVYTL